MDFSSSCSEACLGCVTSILLTRQSGWPKRAKAWHCLSLGELGVDERACGKHFPVQDKQEDRSAGAAFVSQSGCRSVSGLPSWEYYWGKSPTLSLFPPTVALHFFPTSLGLVHSKAGVFGEAWSHFPDSATELITAGLCQLWYWSRMNGLSVCIGPRPQFSTVQEVTTELTFLPTLWFQQCRLSFGA